MQKAECRNAEWLLPSGMQHEANPPHILFLRVGAAPGRPPVAEPGDPQGSPL